ncbi:hypothetical protein EDC96DRAFT_568087 [Choanephora cucurbitarum]|nr:hypothetical protein EDC96DRAFT_568087 [Choanephora cucurbitarum]
MIERYLFEAVRPDMVGEVSQNICCVQPLLIKVLMLLHRWKARLFCVTCFFSGHAPLHDSFSMSIVNLVRLTESRCIRLKAICFGKVKGCEWKTLHIEFKVDNTGRFKVFSSRDLITFHLFQRPGVLILPNKRSCRVFETCKSLLGSLNNQNPTCLEKDGRLLSLLMIHPASFVSNQISPEYIIPKADCSRNQLRCSKNQRLLEIKTKHVAFLAACLFVQTKIKKLEGFVFIFILKRRMLSTFFGTLFMEHRCFEGIFAILKCQK